MTKDRELSPSDWTVLALVAEKPTHGWAISTQLARGGEIGSIWALGRPLVYHALERLESSGLIKTTGLERGARGPHRVMYAATPSGRREVRDWLGKPVEHVRDIRSLFLLKVVLSQRAGIEVEPLLVAQRAVIVPFVLLLEAQLDDLDPTGAPSEATMLHFRLETTQTIVRFIDTMLDQVPRPPRKRASAGRPPARVTGPGLRALDGRAQPRPNLGPTASSPGRGSSAEPGTGSAHDARDGAAASDVALLQDARPGVRERDTALVQRHDRRAVADARVDLGVRENARVAVAAGDRHVPAKLVVRAGRLELRLDLARIAESSGPVSTFVTGVVPLRKLTVCVTCGIAWSCGEGVACPGFRPPR